MSERPESLPAAIARAVPVALPGGAWRPGAHADRRRGGDRRRRLAWSLVYGGLSPRRRGGRRVTDRHRPVVDWHGPGLLASSLLILLLCVADAFLTLLLLTHGAYEANPLMALVVHGDARSFAMLKMALTGSGVVALVAVARFHVFGLMRAGVILHGVVFGYAALIAYEFHLLAQLS